MKRITVNILVAVLAAVLMTMTGCRRYEQIRVTSGRIESISLNGLTALDLSAVVGIDNPAGKVVVKSAKGTVRHFGKIIGKVSLAPMEILPRTASEYTVHARVELARGLGLRDIMSLASPSGLNECTVDVEVKGTVAGMAVKRNFKEIPLKKLLENKKNEKI